MLVSVSEAAAVCCVQVLMAGSWELLGAGGQAEVHKATVPFAVKGVSRLCPSHSIGKSWSSICSTTFLTANAGRAALSPCGC